MPPIAPPAPSRLTLPSLESVEQATDAALTELVTQWGEAKRTVDAGLARLSGEVQRRSSLDRGYDGLAQRSGDRTPDAFISRVTGTSGPEARSLVEVGSMLNQPAPWLAGVATLVESGEVSVAAAGAIKKGLGDPSANVAADDLLDAAAVLIEEAQKHTPEQVAKLARDLRDELDASGVADREQQRRDKRCLKLIPQADGMTRITGLLDPESAAIVKAAIDPLTSPRRGGPRFVDPDDQARAVAVMNDPRTLDQLTHDAVVELIRIGSHADDGRLYGSRKPQVRLHASLAELETRRRVTEQGGDPGTVGGIAWLEGETASVSLATAERLACTDGYYPLLFDGSGDPLRLGRAERCFTEKQRIMLAAIWGGCAVDGCERPPSWTEAHHIDHWNTGGLTDVNRGILLCRHHHLLLHNNGWSITTDGDPADGPWMMQPPPGDPLARPIRLISKNPLRRKA